MKNDSHPKNSVSPQTIPRNPGGTGKTGYAAEEGRYLEAGSLFLGVLIGTIISLVLNLATRSPREGV